MLAVLKHKIDLNTVKACGDRRFILGINAVSERIHAYRSVESAGIDIDITELLCRTSCDGALTRAGRAVYSNIDNIVVHSNVKEKSVKIDVPAPNQYFLRVRAEKEDKSEYGKWSDTISFRVGDRINTEDKDDPNYNDHDYDIDPDIKKDPDIDDPKKDNPDEPDIDIDLETFEVLNKIKQNVTPENILLQLSKEIDPDCVPNIMIIKSEVE